MEGLFWLVCVCFPVGVFEGLAWRSCSLDSRVGGGEGHLFASFRLELEWEVVGGWRSRTSFRLVWVLFTVGVSAGVVGRRVGRRSFWLVRVRFPVGVLGWVAGGDSSLMVEEQDVFLACRGSFPSSSFGGGCRRELLSWSGFVSVAEFWLGCRGSADTASRSLRHETTGMALATGSRGPLEAKPLCALFGLEMRYSFITSDAGRPIDCVSDSNYGDVGSFHEHKFLVGNN